MFRLALLGFLLIANVAIAQENRTSVFDWTAKNIALEEECLSPLNGSFTVTGSRVTIELTEHIASDMVRTLNPQLAGLKVFALDKASGKATKFEWAGLTPAPDESGKIHKPTDKKYGRFLYAERGPIVPPDGAIEIIVITDQGGRNLGAVTNSDSIKKRERKPNALPAGSE